MLSLFFCVLRARPLALQRLVGLLGPAAEFGQHAVLEQGNAGDDVVDRATRAECAEHFSYIHGRPMRVEAAAGWAAAEAGAATVGFGPALTGAAAALSLRGVCTRKSLELGDT